MAYTAPYTERRTGNPAYLAYQILHVGYVAAPLIAGVDKFFHYLTDWHQYLAPFFRSMVPVDTFMRGVGVVEVLAALVVAFWPRVGGYVVAAWLAGIIVNLFMIPGFYDIALRDFGLMLGALALANLAGHFQGSSHPDGTKP